MTQPPPTSDHARHYEAVGHFHRMDAESAARIWSELSRSEPANPHWHYWLALCADVTGQRRRARRLYLLCLSHLSGYTAPAESLLLSFLEKRWFREAAQLVARHYNECGEEFAYGVYLMRDALLSAGASKSKVSEVSVILEQGMPRDAAAHSAMVGLYRTFEIWGRAIDHALLAWELSPIPERALDAGSLMLRGGLYESSVRYLFAGRQVGYESIAYERIGEAYAKAARYERSIKFYERALESCRFDCANPSYIEEISQRLDEVRLKLQRASGSKPRGGD